MPRRPGGGATAGVLLAVLSTGTGVPPGGGDAAAQSPLSPAGEAWFADRAREAGIDFVHSNGASGRLYVSEVLAPGAAMFDFDDDGDLDVYIVQGRMLGPGAATDPATVPPGGAPPGDRLYRNDLVVRADGARTLRFTDVTVGSGLDAAAYGMGVATGDVDNDGRVDLYRTALGAVSYTHLTLPTKRIV